MHIDDLAGFVGEFDTDDVTTGDDGDAHGYGGHGAGDIVGEADDLGGLSPRGGFKLVECDYGAGVDGGDFAFDVEIGEDVLEQLGIAA